MCRAGSWGAGRSAAGGGRQADTDVPHSAFWPQGHSSRQAGWALSVGSFCSGVFSHTISLHCSKWRVEATSLPEHWEGGPGTVFFLPRVCARWLLRVPPLLRRVEPCPVGAEATSLPLLLHSMDALAEAKAPEEEETQERGVRRGRWDPPPRPRLSQESTKLPSVESPPRQSGSPGPGSPRFSRLLGG